MIQIGKVKNMQKPVKDLKEYVAILQARKIYFIIPALIVLLMAIVLALALPSIYESSSTILIEQQQIPPEFVRSTVTGFADQRIQRLTQQIISRVKLWEIIKQFNLYAEMQERYTREEIIEKMRENIKVEAVNPQIGAGGAGRPGSMTIAFSISYRGSNPALVQKVAGTLASLYLEQNLKTREAQAKTTTQFLEAELKELQERIKTVGDKITNFKEKYEGMLPEQQQLNLSQADRLESEIKQLENNIRTTEERKIYLEGQLATVNPHAPGTGGERVMAPQARLRELEVTLADLRAKFSEDHPDIRKALREKAELAKLAGSKGGSSSLRQQKLTQLKSELAEKQGKYSEEHPEIKKLRKEILQLEQEPERTVRSDQMTTPDNPAYVTLTSQIQAAVIDIAALRRQQIILKEKLEMYRKRVEEAPRLEQEYQALQREYTNAHQKHQEI